MISALKIRNFILVDEITIDFTQGLNVITGETGTGKSVIIGAIDAIFDKKPLKNIFYDKDKNAYLEATFLIKKDSEILKKFDLETENGEIFVAREFLTNGNRKSYLNGRRVSQEIVLQLKDYLFDFHSQNKHILYLEPHYQLHLLDLFANNTLLLKNYKEAYNDIIQYATDLKKMIEDEKAQKERIELFRYQYNELEQADLKIDEDEYLEKEFSKLSHAEELIGIFGEMNYEFYDSEQSVYNKIAGKLNELQNYGNDIDAIKEATDYLSNILENLDNIIAISRNIEDEVFVDKEHLQDISKRLDSLNTLKNKYDMNISELIEYKEKIKTSIENYQTNESKIKQGYKILSDKVENISNLAEKLSNARKLAAKRFASKIEEGLQKLSLPNAKFKITIDKKSPQKEVMYDFKIHSITGWDRVEFLFSANRGKKLQPIKIAASGGEISRIVLSIKKELSDAFIDKTLIFDEIDAGIGGKTAKVTGEFIHKVAKKSQVITITHLARIASYADRHFKIDKSEERGKTKIYLELLDKNNRILEIARMLSGNTSETAINHAKEILRDKE